MRFYRTIVVPLLHLLTPTDKRRGTAVIILLVINSILDFFSVASFLPVLYVIVNPDSLSSNGKIDQIYRWFNFSSHTSFIIAMTLAVLFLTCVKNIVSLLITRFKSSYVFTVGSDLSSRAMSGYMEMSYLKFTRLDFARELNRIASLPIAFANNIILPLGTILSEGFVFLLLLGCIVMYDIKVFLFLAIILIPTGVLYRLKRKNMKQTSLDLQEKYPLTLKYALQVVEGLYEIKAFAKESYFKSRFTALSRSLAKTFMREHVGQSGTLRLTEIISAFVICSLIIYSVLINQNYQQTILLLGIYAGVGFRVIPSINRMLNAFVQIRTHEYLFHELEGLTEFKINPKPKAYIPDNFKHQIELEGVSFQYPDGPDVLKNVSLRIQKGEKIALLGKSGSGKTTLLLILLRFIRDHSGRILIDGRQMHSGVEEMNGSFIAYVPQNPYILDASILENIAFGSPSDQINTGKVRQLITELDLDDILLSSPEGLSTRIGEKGVRLSGGQRQRIAIARALYTDAEVLLLDEITNQLDAQTEQEIIKTLKGAAFQTKTILMITHHADLLSHFDRVVRLEHGTLKEELLAQPSS